MVRKRASERVEPREPNAVDSALCEPLPPPRKDTKGGTSTSSVELRLTGTCVVHVDLGRGVTAESLRTLGTVVRELAKQEIALKRLRAKHAVGDWRDAAASRHGVVARLGGAAWDAVFPALDEAHMRPAWSLATIDALARAVAKRWSKMSTPELAVALDVLNGLELARRTGSGSEALARIRASPYAAKLFSEGQAGFAALERVKPSDTAGFVRTVVLTVVSLAFLALSLWMLVFKQELGITRAFVEMFHLEEELERLLAHAGSAAASAAD